MFERRLPHHKRVFKVSPALDVWQSDGGAGEDKSCAERRADNIFDGGHRMLLEQFPRGEYQVGMPLPIVACVSARD